MKEGIKRFFQGVGLAVGLGMGGEAAMAEEPPNKPVPAESAPQPVVEVKIPEPFTAENVPVISAEVYEQLSEVQRIQLAGEILKYFEIIFPDQLGNSSKWNAFSTPGFFNDKDVEVDKFERLRFAIEVFEIARLRSSMLARRILDQAELLDEAERKSFTESVTNLGTVELKLGDFAATKNWLDDMMQGDAKTGKKKLYLILAELQRVVKERGGARVPGKSEAKATFGPDDATAPTAKLAGPAAGKTPETAKKYVRKKPRQNEYVSYGDPREKKFPGTFFGEGVVTEIEGKPTFALTFDDGPDPKYTPEILKIFRESNIKATFFVVGKQMALCEKSAACKDILKQMVAGGHEIGLHSSDHSDLKKTTDTPEQVFAKHAAELNAALKRQTGQEATVFRPPFGNITPEQIAEFAKHGMRIVSWSIDTEDWRQGSKKPTPEQIVKRVTDNAYGGGIALLHSGGGNRAATVEATREIIKYLTAQGYLFVSTSTIIGTVEAKK